MTMNTSWGYNRNDDAWKSPETLIRQLVDAASKGGNYLLNVGPTAEGEIPPESVERLAELGKWMARYGESIYGTTANPFEQTPWGRCTVKRHERGTTLYVHIFERPEDGVLRIPAFEGVVRNARWVGGDEVAIRSTDPGREVEIDLPDELPDVVDAVLAIEYDPADH